MCIGAFPLIYDSNRSYKTKLHEFLTCYICITNWQIRCACRRFVTIICWNIKTLNYTNLPQAPTSPPAGTEHPRTNWWGLGPTSFPPICHAPPCPCKGRQDKLVGRVAGNPPTNRFHVRALCFQNTPHSSTWPFVMSIGFVWVCLNSL